MKVVVADQNKLALQALKDYVPTFEWHEGDPLAYEIDAVVSPANTAGIMNGGYDATLRRHFGNTLEYRVRMSIKEKPIAVGEARAIQTVDPKVKWLIVMQLQNNLGLRYNLLILFYFFVILANHKQSVYFGIWHLL